MTEYWEEQETKYTRRTPAQRFKITYEQIDLLSWMAFDSNNEEYQYLAYENGTGKDLLEAIGDHLSINDLKQIVQVFSEELALREEKHSGEA